MKKLVWHLINKETKDRRVGANLYCLHFHKGALACKLTSTPCIDCSLFEPSTKKKKADSKVKKVSVIENSKIKDKKDKEENLIKEKLTSLNEKECINFLKRQISNTLNCHTKGISSNSQLFTDLQMYLTRLHPSV